MQWQERGARRSLDPKGQKRSAQGFYEALGYASIGERPERLSIGLQEKKWLVRRVGVGRSKSRVGVGCGDGARRCKGYGRATFCG